LTERAVVLTLRERRTPQRPQPVFDDTTKGKEEVASPVDDRTMTHAQ
jgi:hypothetical protein